MATEDSSRVCLCSQVVMSNMQRGAMSEFTSCSQRHVSAPTLTWWKVRQLKRTRPHARATRRSCHEPRLPCPFRKASRQQELRTPPRRHTVSTERDPSRRKAPREQKHHDLAPPHRQVQTLRTNCSDTASQSTGGGAQNSNASNGASSVSNGKRTNHRRTFLNLSSSVMPRQPWKWKWNLMGVSVS